MAKKILVADDDKVVLDVISRLLKANNYDIIEAFSGMRVVSLASNEKPDLILLDNFMPSGTGFSIMDKLKKSPETSEIPVIIITGSSSKQMHDLALELGAVDFIGKPFDMQVMLNKIKEALGETKKMEKLLHIIATPRGEDSRTLKVSQAFIENLQKKFTKCSIDELNVAVEPLPPLTVKVVSGKYVLLSGKELSQEQKKAWRDIERHIERFLLADAYLLSLPMWNFSIPYTLKHYLDVILQPKYLFRYTPSGPEGLVKNKKMVVVTSRGGDYSDAMRSADFQEPYLRFVFGFVGITDITFINAQPMDALGLQIQAERIEEAKSIARKTADSF
ncbi:MAG: NAD(P)H-dependent oxidoreductase [Candidatus Omnitrophica bacterium]|nr:NAD(P)H-dependent oxidoreductase [Candidatus Omnitrophota bacterium]